tara:strand:- start:1135 stop:1827 length:693 start_codon:yes stop_codon:yes gene_type:complete
MKTITLIAVLMLALYSAQAQLDSEQRPRVFFSSGFVTPQFFSGIELMSALDNREKGLSNYTSSEGTQQSIGSSGANTGFSLGIGYYLPIQKVRGLSIGLMVNSAQTGSTPSRSGYNEGYFFNFLNFSGSVQYYPFAQADLYVKGEVGMGSVWTKNRFINEMGDQDFLHHFGIGLEAGAAIGYTKKPFKNKNLGIFVEGQYQYYQTRVEVSDIGDDQWQFGALRLAIGIEF